MPLSGPNSYGSLTWARNACARRRYGIRQYSSLQTIQQEAVDDALAFAMDRIAMEGAFQWLRKESGLVTVAPYSDGTVDVTAESTTVTGNSTAFNTSSNALQHDAFNVSEGGFGRVESVDSDTQLTLQGGYGGSTASAASYELARDQYTLPTDFLRLVSVREVDQIQELVVVSRNQWASLWHGDYTTGRPRYALLAGADDSLTSMAQRIQLYPLPDAVYSYQVLYDALPAWESTGGNPEPGSPQAMEALVAASLAHLYQHDRDRGGGYEATYRRAVNQLQQTQDRSRQQRIFAQGQWARGRAGWPVNYAEQVSSSDGS